MTMPKNLVKDFAQRTRKNLETIRRLEKASPDGEFYEVTQLINSMLGLLVFPRQEFTLPRTPIKDLAKDGWAIPKVLGGHQQVSDLYELISFLRHAIAHFNLKFIPDANDEIVGVEVWNEHPPKNEIWRAKLTLEELENIVDKFSALLVL